MLAQFYCFVCVILTLHWYLSLSFFRENNAVLDKRDSLFLAQTNENQISRVKIRMGTNNLLKIICF